MSDSESDTESDSGETLFQRLPRVGHPDSQNTAARHCPRDPPRGQRTRLDSPAVTQPRGILRQLRTTRSLSYEQVREKTGLSQQLIYDVEYKDRRLSLAELAALARCYEVSINDILGIDVEQ